MSCHTTNAYYNYTSTLVLNLPYVSAREYMYNIYSIPEVSNAFSIWNVYFTYDIPLPVLYYCLQLLSTDTAIHGAWHCKYNCVFPLLYKHHPLILCNAFRFYDVTHYFTSGTNLGSVFSYVCMLYIYIYIWPFSMYMNDRNSVCVIAL